MVPPLVLSPAAAPRLRPLLPSFTMQAFPASSFTRLISAQPFPALLRGSWIGNASKPATASSKLVVGSTTAVKAALRGSAASALLLGPYWVVAVGKYIAEPHRTRNPDYCQSWPLRSTTQTYHSSV